MASQAPACIYMTHQWLNRQADNACKTLSLNGMLLLLGTALLCHLLVCRCSLQPWNACKRHFLASVTNPRELIRGMHHASAVLALT